MRKYKMADKDEEIAFEDNVRRIARELFSGVGVK